MIEENLNQTIERITRASTSPTIFQSDSALTPPGSTAILVVPDDCHIKGLEDYLPAPNRIKADRAFVSIESFVRYVNEFKIPGSRMFVDRAGNARCIIDDHHRNGEGMVPKWGSHHARFSMAYTAQWLVWIGQDKKSFEQRSFANFIENNQPDFLSPVATHMLDIARTLDAEQSSIFKSAIRTESNDVNVSYSRTTNLKAGQTGDLSIPTQFSLSIPLLEGEQPRAIEVRLRIDLENDKLKLSYEILRRQQLLDGVVQSVYATIANATGLTPFLVQNVSQI